MLQHENDQITWPDAGAFQRVGIARRSLEEGARADRLRAVGQDERQRGTLWRVRQQVAGAVEQGWRLAIQANRDGGRRLRGGKC